MMYVGILSIQKKDNIARGFVQFTLQVRHVTENLWKYLKYIIYNHFTGKLRKFYFTKGSRDMFCQTKYTERSEGSLLKLVEGTRC